LKLIFNSRAKVANFDSQDEQNDENIGTLPTEEAQELTEKVVS